MVTMGREPERVESARISTVGLRPLVVAVAPRLLVVLESEVTRSVRWDCDELNPLTTAAAITLSKLTRSVRWDCDLPGPNE